MIKKIMALTLIAVSVHAAEEKDIMSAFQTVVLEARQIQVSAAGEPKGKFTDLIEKARTIDLGENPSESHQMMKKSLIAELYSVNGDYDKSNDMFRETYKIMPEVTFYRKMVVNMRLKKDEKAAQAVVDEFKAIMEKEMPEEKDKMRRQEIIQFVESGLADPLPGTGGGCAHGCQH